ncbi:MAG: hypothetical protein QOJ85_2315 [Solirubrobacteraceae bacterium]|jgi:hypothetical protein|nr:hypothetical protein [Solirubrobacteraceae bacterium]MEA2245446.1 hypothetical protein [Solirubrobacteraceae bacterium]
MAFLARAGTRPYTAHLQIRALDAWRAAARIVSAQWESVLVADRAARDDAFAAYVVALDAEAAAADELAALYFRDAA